VDFFYFVGNFRSGFGSVARIVKMRCT